MQPELQSIRQDSNLIQGVSPAAQAASLQHGVLRNTYWLLALSLIPTVIGAVIGAGIDVSFMRTSPVMSFIAILAIFYGWIYAIERNRTSAIGVVLLLGFTLFLGMLLAPTLQRVLGFRNGVELVMMAAGGTAAVFFIMAGIASTSKRDFSKLGQFMTVGAVVIMLAVVANLFIASPAMQLAIVAAFVIFSSLMILHQVSQIVRGGETNYVSATLTLYIAIYNLFSSLLQLLGFFGGSKD